MCDVERALKEMDFEFFATSQHKMPEETFLGQRDAVLLDVRAAEEVRAVRIALEGVMASIHIPLHELPDRAGEVPKDKLVGIFCSSGTRAAMAFLYLRGLGYENVKILVHGYGPFMDALKPGKLAKLVR